MSNRAILSPNLLHARIQQYQTVPREKGAIARTDTTTITQGRDGRTYRLLNNDDSKVCTTSLTHSTTHLLTQSLNYSLTSFQVYRVMDESDLENEMLSIKQVENDLKEMNRSVKTKGESRIHTIVPNMSTVKVKSTPSASSSPPKEIRRKNNEPNERRHSFTHSLTHSLTHLLTYSLTH